MSVLDAMNTTINGAPFVSQDTRVVYEDSHSAKCVDSALNYCSTI